MTLNNNTPSATQTMVAELTALLRARNHLIWVTTREEERAETGIITAAATAGYTPRTWDCATGTTNLNGTEEPFSSRDIGETLETILKRAESSTNNGRADRGLWILRDAHDWTTGPIGIQTRRQLRNLARRLPRLEPAQAIVILTPSGDIPPELACHTTALDWPLPDRTEMAEILDDAIQCIPAEKRTGALNGSRNAAIDAAVGLTSEEAASCYAKSLVTTQSIDPKLVSAEKKKLITRVPGLEWYDPNPNGLAALGGYSNLKSWLLQRSDAYTPTARDYNLPAPRGILVVGISGCGKSLLCKAIPTTWGVPLLKVDLGGAKDKFVGSSEANIRRIRQVSEAVGRCVLWFDEIEKTIQNTNTDASDGGVSSDQIGFLLSWMQERTSEAFFIATANNVTKLPPELFRSGRFDEIFSIDIPSNTERAEILDAALREYKRKPITLDNTEIIEATSGFTGAEIASLVPKAMYVAFADNKREITTADLVSAARRVIPFTKTNAETVESFRRWAAGRTTPASNPEQQPPTTPNPTRRILDLNPN